MICRATVTDHCCWIPPFGVCPYFDASTGEPRCSLRVELGSWQAVHADPRYVRDVKPAMPTVQCGDWPPAGEKCGTCGVIGDG